VADSGYAKVAFLAALVGLTHVCGLVRLASNRMLYGAPPPADRHPTTGKRRRRGRPPVHGAKFALKSPPPPAQHRPVTLGGTAANLSAWTGLHFKALPRLVGLVVRVEFLQADGTPKYRRPLWLFWTGPDTLPGPPFPLHWAHRPRPPDRAEKAPGARWGIGRRRAPGFR